jgi:aspartyl/asparaginyl beta-hydroxylase (cupin superfamily)|tara:strand:+ start:951 stop:1184 length:234 start_codon:yes stop_codon:yes gene_type:complete
MSGVTLTGVQIDVFRAQTILRGLYMEAKHNMRLTAKAQSCYSLAKKEFGLKGNKAKVYNDLAEMFVKAGIVEDYRKL